MRKNLNNIQVWLEPKLAAAGLSVERFARMCRVSRTSMYFYLIDTSRPTEQTMVRMCHVLGVPLEEGLAQYTPKKNGRPKGTQNINSVTVDH